MRQADQPEGADPGGRGATRSPVPRPSPTPIPHKPSAHEGWRAGIAVLLCTTRQAMDSEAFVDAHRRYAAVVYARCRRMLRDGEAARDVTQEVFVRCFDRRRQLHTGGDLLAWLYRVATNLCLNQLRDHKPRPATDAAVAAQPVWREKPSVSEVLQLLAGLDEKTQAIAIYRKFGVSSRRSAVSRMHELGLLPHD